MKSWQALRVLMFIVATASGSMACPTPPTNANTGAAPPPPSAATNAQPSIVPPINSAMSVKDAGVTEAADAEVQVPAATTSSSASAVAPPCDVACKPSEFCVLEFHRPGTAQAKPFTSKICGPLPAQTATYQCDVDWKNRVAKCRRTVPVP